ncbi:MAG: hypothetical protein K0R57_872 [Paenibacillaceae bacterium]|jgi:carbon-monoxide dehydrogenase medium subunit|nr:hypothetical protein [Paenibacillaceae bacterium]
MAMESHELHLGPGETTVWRPNSVEEAWQYKQRFGGSALYVAGGTWLRTRWEARQLPSPPDCIISLENIAGLRSLSFQQDRELTIGACVRLAELLSSGVIAESFPLIMLAAANIAAPSIRNQATIGGNVMSGVGDLLPALIAAEAEMLIYDGRRTDRIPVEDWVELKSRPEELLLTGLRLHAVAVKHRCFFHKIGRREQFTPSIITAAGWYHAEADGQIAKIRLAAGSSAMKPMRLRQAEIAALIGKPASLAADVHRAVRSELPELADDYASADYRKLAAANLIAAELLNNGGGTDAAKP